MMERLLNPIKARIRLMVGKCLITACGGNTVDLSLLAGETRDEVDFYQQYGFTSRPVGKVGGVALFIGGSRDNGVVVASRGEDKKMAIDLEPGEVALHTSFGSSIVLKKDGSVLVKPKNGKVMRVEGDVNVVGNVWATKDFAALCVDAGGTMAEGLIHLTKHTHPSAVGPTAPTTGP